MTKQHNQQGFSVFTIVIIIAVVAIVGLVGFNVYNRQQNKSVANDETTSTQIVAEQASTASDVKTAPTINNTSDLDSAEKTLDQTDPSGSNNSDASQLDSQTANF
ncbi:MAG: hypothetical protein WCP03_02930 [Candidatus Saccharibacteria bacterium]